MSQFVLCDVIFNTQNMHLYAISAVLVAVLLHISY